MKQRLFLLGVLLLVGGALCVGAVAASWWMAERVFFDRFFTTNQWHMAISSQIELLS